MNEEAAAPAVNIPYAEKAAILLLSIGEVPAAAVLKQLGPKEVQRIGGTMAA
ncbi:MAG: flagellar motor switch protein FliG, partial [Pseudomonadales bacterium]|nr:flagellar motor switch protein FliG [Pseudomonadales bacterium]